MNTQAVEYLTTRREELLTYIKRKGLSQHDAEDLLTEATVDVLTYYKEDRVKSVHLAIGRQLDKYYRGFGTVAHKVPPEDIVVYKEGDWLDDLTRSQSTPSADPLELLLVQEAQESYLESIQKLTDNTKHQHFLELVYIEGVPAGVAQDIVGISANYAQRLQRKFLNSMGE